MRRVNVQPSWRNEIRRRRVSAPCSWQETWKQTFRLIPLALLRLQSKVKLVSFSFAFLSRHSDNIGPRPAFVAHNRGRAYLIPCTCVFKRIKKSMQNGKSRYVLRKGIRHGGGGLFVKGRDTGATPKGKRFKRTLI